MGFLETLIIAVGLVVLCALLMLDISELVDSGLERQRRTMEDGDDGPA